MNSLLLGNCLEILCELPSNSVDLVLTDPPYEVIPKKWDRLIPLDILWKKLDRVCKPTANIVMTAMQPFTTHLITSNLKMFKYTMVWMKNRSTCVQQSKNRPMIRHEDIVVFSKLGVGHFCQLKDHRMTYNPVGMVVRDENAVVTVHPNSKAYGDRPNQIGNKFVSYTGMPDTILQISMEKKTLHPTQKPVELFKKLVEMYSNKGATVLDFAMGSGTTGVACNLTTRNFIGIEIDKEYFDIAKSRLGNI